VSGQPFDDTRQPGAPELNYEPSIVGTTDPASTSLPILCGPQDLPPIVTTLHPGGIVEGHVYTATGEIAPYAHVQIQGVPLPCPCQGSFNAYTTDGSFAFVGLPAGDYTIIAVDKAIQADRITAHVEPGQTVTRDLHLSCGGPCPAWATSS
jgi:hypothetical protein